MKNFNVEIILADGLIVKHVVEADLHTSEYLESGGRLYRFYTYTGEPAEEGQIAPNMMVREVSVCANNSSLLQIG